MFKVFAILFQHKTLLRRLALVVGASVVLLVTGIMALVVTRDYTAIEKSILARYEQEVGVTLRFEGRRQAFWPRPQLIYDNVSIRRRAGDAELRAPQAIIQFDIFDLLDGSIDGPSLTLMKPEIRVDFGAIDAAFRSPRTIATFLDRFVALFDRTTTFGRFRLGIDDARLTFARGGLQGEDVTLTDVRGRVRYLAGRGRIDVDVTSNGLPEGAFQLAASMPTFAALAKAKQGAASIQLAAFGSRLTFGGSMRRDPDIALIGRVEAQVSDWLETRVVNRVAKRGATPEPPIAIAAAMALDPRGIALENLKITRGSRQLAGIAALRENNSRWGLSATLAGDLVDGTAAHAALQRLTLPDGSWSREPLSITPLPMIDLDIRLSTREFKLGNVILGNVALSVLTRHGRTELAIVDSRFGEGTVKARVSLIDTQDRQQDLRLQATAERVDIGRFMERAFTFNRLAGEGTFVVQAESRGGSIAELVGGLAGTATLDVRNGDVTGIDLAKLLNRATDARQDAALLLALAGKTSFETLRVNFAIKDGRIEPVGSNFISPRVVAMLEGQIDLVAQRHQLIMILRRRVEEAPLPTEFYAFRLEGSLFAPTIRPDLRLLQNRS